MRVAIWTSIGFNRKRSGNMKDSMVQNQLLVTVLHLCVLLLAALPAAATEHEVDHFGAILDTCYGEATDQAARTACIGKMATACMDEQDGGHSTLGMTSCLAAEAQVWDKHLNAEYKAARVFAQAMDKDEAVYFPEFARRAETLLAAQRAWILFRDAECDLERAEWGSGSMRHIAYTDCKMRMTADRTLRLRAMREDLQ